MVKIFVSLDVFIIVVDTGIAWVGHLEREYKCFSASLQITMGQLRSLCGIEMRSTSHKLPALFGKHHSPSTGLISYLGFLSISLTCENVFV